MRNVLMIFALLAVGYSSRAADPGWSVSAASFSYSMTVTAVLQTDCNELVTSNNRLGAFVGGVVRGSALNSVNVNGRQLVFLTVYSNTVGGETVTFKIYNAQTDAIIDVVGTLVFQDDASFGTPNSPILMTDNHVPTNLSLSGSSVMENNAVGYTIGNLSVSDQDATDTHTYGLVAGTGDTDNASFSVVGNELRIQESADYETKTSYSIRLSGMDNKGCSVVKVFAISVLPFNDPPTDILLSANAVNEDAEVGTVIGTLSSVDEDADETFTYSLVVGAGDTDNGLFMIDGDQLKAVGPFNYEGQASHSIRVRTTDAGTSTFEKEFSIAVIDVNEAPYNVNLTPAEVDENLVSGSLVGDFTATDEDAGDVVTFTLDPSNVDQSNWFEIVNNQLLTKVSFNYEELALYSVDVIASDVAGLMASMSFDIDILDANDAPTDLSLSASSFLEDQPIGALVGEFSAVDEDAVDSFTYDFVSGSNDNASFTISGNQLLSNESFKYNRKDSYAIEVAVTDLANESFSKALTINIEKLAESVLPSIDLVTPNGDGINDTWFIQGVEKFSNFELRIYDSSGLLVYNVKENYDNSWNGTQGNRRLSTGTYYYMLTSNSGSNKSYKGTISLFN
jgi:gliding motility-associated-like protein